MDVGKVIFFAQEENVRMSKKTHTYVNVFVVENNGKIVFIVVNFALTSKHAKFINGYFVGCKFMASYLTAWNLSADE